ncbi:MAG: hypothetical protein IPP98_13590 [Gemmatimonadetes bacterium]|nr:hypothetical protein [Gemmatimonadota bacterium]
MKNLVFALSAAALVSAAPLQAQAFSGFTANNDGVEFWDNLSDDGLALNPNNCNSGFVVTGVAPTSCINQRPNTWLPYTGTPANEYWNLSGNWAPIVFSGGRHVHPRVPRRHHERGLHGAVRRRRHRRCQSRLGHLRDQRSLHAV